jgi:hypothetical protein
MFIDKDRQPLKWGQTIVIDQELLHGVKEYNDLYTISEEVVAHTNKFLLKEEDIYRTKNTHTRFKSTFEEQEMSKTLTYYAITNGKSAFGHETSKSLQVNARIYYKLLAIEKFMDIMGIEYKRKFDMTLAGIDKVINEYIEILFDGTNIKIIRMHTNRQIILPTITYSQVTVTDIVPLSAVTPTADALSEIGSNRFTPKNLGKYIITAYATPTTALQHITFTAQKNGSGFGNGSRDSVNTASVEVRSNISCVFTATTIGDYFTLTVVTSALDSAMRCQLFTVTPI